MAQKRMFNKTLTNSDEFLDLPDSSQVLYFHLSMNADDEGFVNNWKSIIRMTGTKEDDLKLLIAKSFIIPFDSGVIVIRHWKLNNYLQNDRIKPTQYQEELKDLEIDNGVYILTTNDFNNISFENENISTKEKRKLAYKESELPYSFDYKIRNAFTDEICPICHYKMANYVNSPHRPTIQHNIPISKGGKHELGNISVVCHQCNVSIKDEITSELNSKDVIKKWEEINECIQPRIQTCIHSIDNNSIVKNRIEYNNNVDFESEFEEIWKLYPNKQGKSNALKSYIKARKSGIDKEIILNGLNNYLDYIKFNKIDNQYIKHGSTWFNQQCWNDIYNMQKTLKQKTNNIFEELLQEEKNEKRTNIIDVEYTEKSIS